MLAEELRQDAAASVRYLLEEGITIKVLSGDAPRAVAAIAGRAGIPAGGPPRDASALVEEDIGDVLAWTNVLGRVRPEQKLAAVKVLQAAGHVVAMCGNGVNDVQALKQADLGIAMGTGSQASRSVARVVLLDGTFAAIPPMLAEGRRLVANIERVAGLFVTKTVYAAIIAVGAAGIMGLWVLVLVAGRSTAGRIVLIAAMAAGLVPLFAVPAIRRVLALQLPPAGTLAATAGVVLAAILALTLWRRASRSTPSQSPSS